MIAPLIICMNGHNVNLGFMALSMSACDEGGFIMSEEEYSVVCGDGDDGVWDGKTVLIIALLWAIIALGSYYAVLRLLF